MFKAINRYQIQYLGNDGITQYCLTAITDLLQTHSDFDAVILLSYEKQHAFIIKDHFEVFYAIRSGFTSGYSGEGPRGLATVLHGLEKHQMRVEEILVPQKIIQRLNQARLSDQDIDDIFSKPVIRPMRLADYTYPFRNQLGNLENIKQYYPLELPYAILDERLFDLALLFKSDPDSSISNSL